MEPFFVFPGESSIFWWRMWSWAGNLTMFFVYHCSCDLILDMFLWTFM